VIRGNIDAVSRTRVEGWMYSEQVSLTGARVLAFVDDDCVGTGVVDLFRQDLVDARLGDGMAGFSFPISLAPSQDPRMLDVRLEGSDALIRQRASRSVPRDDIGAKMRRAPRDPQSLSWMRARGWLTADQYDALRVLGEFGVYGQRVRPGAAEQIARSAGELLELMMFNAVTPLVHTGLAARELVGELASERRSVLGLFPDAVPVIGLWAPQPCCLNVIEGSHLMPLEEPAVGGIDYEFGGDSLLWINLDCKYTVPTGGITVLLTAIIPGRPEPPEVVR
jgi:hypothetical protein